LGNGEKEKHVLVNIYSLAVMGMCVMIILLKVNVLEIILVLGTMELVVFLILV
jgi:hypothetical protein